MCLRSMNPSLDSTLNMINDKKIKMLTGLLSEDPRCSIHLPGFGLANAINDVFHT